MSLNYNCLFTRLDVNSGTLNATWDDVVNAFLNGLEVKVVIPVAENFIPVEAGDNCGQYIGTIRELNIDDSNGDTVYVAVAVSDIDGATSELYALDPGEYLAASFG